MQNRAVRPQSGEAASAQLAVEESLVNAHYQPLRQMLIRLCGDEMLAEDLTHDALLVVLEKLRQKRLSVEGSLAGYLRQTAKNLYIGKIREDVRRATRPCASVPEQPVADLGYGQRLSDERNAELARRIAALTVSRDQEILRRYLLGRQGKQDICHDLSLSSEHFDRVLCRAKSRLLAGTAAKAAGRRSHRPSPCPSAGSVGPANTLDSSGPAVRRQASASARHVA